MMTDFFRRLSGAPWHTGAWRATLVLIGLLPVWLLSGCALHPGADEVAFLRGGRLWLVNPDGTGLVRASGGGVVSFAWSPDHHQLVFRTASAGAIVPADALT